MGQMRNRFVFLRQLRLKILDFFFILLPNLSLRLSIIGPFAVQLLIGKGVDCSRPGLRSLGGRSRL